MRESRKRTRAAHPMLPDSDDPTSTAKVDVWQSFSSLPPQIPGEDDPKKPWVKLIKRKPRITSIDPPSSSSDSSVIRFSDDTTLTNVDVIIFATGYLFYYPFFKAQDYPWSLPDYRVCDQTLDDIDIWKGVNDCERGGIQGMDLKNLDEIKLFLKQDRSMAFLQLRECRRVPLCPIGAWPTAREQS